MTRTQQIRALVVEHQRLIAFTFHVFWVIVFLLNRTGPHSASEIPQFIYVNF
jgi:hypothetical protein